MSHRSLNFGKAELAPGGGRRLLWVLLIGSLLTLPNAVAIAVSEAPRASLVLWLHGLSSLLLPCLFGLRVRLVLRGWWFLSAIGPAAAAYVLATRYPPNAWAVLALMETIVDSLWFYYSKNGLLFSNSLTLVFDKIL